MQQWMFDPGTNGGSWRVVETKTLLPAKPWHFQRLALARDGKHFAALNDSQFGLAGDVAGTNLTLLEDYSKRNGNFIHLNPDGRWVMTGNNGGTQLNIYDARDGRHVIDLPSGSGYGMFQTHGNLVVGKSHTDYGLWRVDTWELVRRIP